MHGAGLHGCRVNAVGRNGAAIGFVERPHHAGVGRAANLRAELHCSLRQLGGNARCETQTHRRYGIGCAVAGTWCYPKIEPTAGGE